MRARKRWASNPKRRSSQVKSTSGSAFLSCVSTAARRRPSSLKKETRAPQASVRLLVLPTAKTSTPSRVASATAATSSVDFSAQVHASSRPEAGSIRSARTFRTGMAAKRGAANVWWSGSGARPVTFSWAQR